ncbi:MAG: 5,10-methylenetetrahydrofolate reductase [Nitriliruptor sp.]|nr:MAG: 5,10-methylenetetrahydrofolate reductase [Nitriliruptor sp.]
MVDERVVASLERARFEIIPMKGVDDQLPFLPAGVTVTVTASPTKGLDATLELAERVAQRGNPVVPHLSARLVEGREHLARILARLEALGVEEVFVPAGDTEIPAGPYEGAADLLEEMTDLGHHLQRVGITGYPESHAFIPDATTIVEMTRKAPHATAIVSQICYDPTIIRSWVSEVRARGVDLPIYLGVPGVIDRAKLLRVSLRVGLGDSIRYLRKQHEVATRLLTGYTPDELVGGLGDLIDHPDARVAGWHLFTFNEVERTERWRQELLLSLRGAAL